MVQEVRGETLDEREDGSGEVDNVPSGLKRALLVAQPQAFPPKSFFDVQAVIG